MNSPSYTNNINQINTPDQSPQSFQDTNESTIMLQQRQPDPSLRRPTSMMSIDCPDSLFRKGDAFGEQPLRQSFSDENYM